jgi:uncharacterized protein (TIGR03437 family)
MRTLRKIRVIGYLSMLGAPAAMAQPVINPGGVVHGASYIPGGLPGSGIPRGGIFVVFGKGLGPATLATAVMPFPTSVSGTSIRVSPVSGGARFDAYVIYSSAGQVAGILPSNTPEGPADVTVTYNNQTSAQVRTTVVRSNFGIFARSGAGYGPAIIQNFNSPSDVPLNGFTNAAQAGQTLILWGTGLGPINAPDNIGPPVGDVASDIEVIVDGKSIRPFYAGRAPGYPGVDQLNFTLPGGSDISDGCTVPVSVKIGNSTSNQTTLAKATGKKVCTHPLFSEAVLAKMDGGVNMTIGHISLRRDSLEVAVAGQSIENRSEWASADFIAINSSVFLGLNTGDFVPLTVTSGSCSVTTFRTRIDPDTLPGAPPPALSLPSFTVLDAGEKLVLRGPGGKTKDIPRRSGSYDTELSSGGSFPGLPSSPPYLEAGEWTIIGAGGRDVGPFTARIVLPVPLNWTNRGTVSAVNRNGGLTVEWDGGGSGPSDSVSIDGHSAAPLPEDPNTIVGGFFTCVVPARNRSFTVPSSILTRLPASEFGSLSVDSEASSEVGRFSAPLTAGGSLDLAFFTSSIGFSKALPYR